MVLWEQVDSPFSGTLAGQDARSQQIFDTPQPFTAMWIQIPKGVLYFFAYVPKHSPLLPVLPAVGISPSRVTPAPALNLTYTPFWPRTMGSVLLFHCYNLPGTSFQEFTVLPCLWACVHSISEYTGEVGKYLLQLPRKKILRF